MLLKTCSKWLFRSGAARGGMHRNVVNSRTANIFKGILQPRISTGNGKRFAKMRRRKMCGSRVYHGVINHAARSSELYDLFRPGKGAAHQGNLLFQRQGKVESRCGAVTVGRTHLFPPLSSGGDLYRIRLNASAEDPLTLSLSPWERGRQNLRRGGPAGPSFTPLGLARTASANALPLGSHLFSPLGAHAFSTARQSTGRSHKAAGWRRCL